MIQRHLLLKYDKEDMIILFLYFDEELGSFSKEKKKSLKDVILDYMRIHKLSKNGEKILIVVGGVILATFVYTKNDLSISKLEGSPPYIAQSLVEMLQTNNEESLSSANAYSAISSEVDVAENTQNSLSAEQDQKIVIYRSSGEIETLPIEEYVVGVVAAEMPASFKEEALKSQAILARTYAKKSMETGKILTDTPSTQSYIDIVQRQTKWLKESEKYEQKIRDAVLETKGLIITYDNQTIDAVYHSISNGYTEDAIEVWGYSIPYLKSVESLGDSSVSTFLKKEYRCISSVLDILDISSLEEIKIIKRDESGRVSEVLVGNEIFRGTDIRELLKLRSTDFEIESENDQVIITTKGFGQGVGMSQYGANHLAKQGYSYQDILKHYYTGIKIEQM